MKKTQQKYVRRMKQVLKFLKGTKPLSGILDFEDGHGLTLFYIKRKDNCVRIGLYYPDTKVLRFSETFTAKEFLQWKI